jgi:hypothetical protein
MYSDVPAPGPVSVKEGFSDPDGHTTVVHLPRLHYDVPALHQVTFHTGRLAGGDFEPFCEEKPVFPPGLEDRRQKMMPRAKIMSGRLVGTRTPDLHRVKVAL